MAQRITYQLVDDLDGSVLAEGEGTTVSFSLNGTAYEIDLTNAHAEELRTLLAPYVAAGRRTGSGAGARSTTAPRTRASGKNADTPKIRAWAVENGYELSERGRIPASIVEAYRAAH